MENEMRLEEDMVAVKENLGSGWVRAPCRYTE